MRKIIFLLAALVIILIAYSDSLKNMFTKSDGSKVLVVGTSADNPPYEFLNEHQQVIGIDIDIANEIAKRLGYKLKVQNMDFQGLIPSLKAKRLSCVIAGLSKTSDREEQVSFSIPYLTTDMALLFHKSNTINILEDLKDKRIGAQSGTSWEQLAKQLVSAYSGTTLQSLNNNLLLVEELQQDKLDVVILEHYQARKLQTLNQDLHFMLIPGAKSEFAIAFTKDDPLLEQVNQVITELQSNGTMQVIHQAYFSENAIIQE